MKLSNEVKLNIIMGERFWRQNNLIWQPCETLVDFAKRCLAWVRVPPLEWLSNKHILRLAELKTIEGFVQEMEDLIILVALDELEEKISKDETLAKNILRGI